MSSQGTQEVGCGKATVYLCRCGGEISGNIDLDEVTKRVSLLPDVSAVICHDALCSEGGRAFLREAIGRQTMGRAVIGACSAEVLDVPLAEEFEAVGANKYLVDYVDIREQCAWVHPDAEAATAKAAALVRGGVRRSLKQEAMEDLVFPVEGATLIVGAGEAGSAAAEIIASSGFKAHVVDMSDRICDGESLVDARPSGSNCRACGMHDSKECPAPSDADKLLRNDNIKLLLSSKIEGIEGGVGKWLVRVRTPKGTEEFVVGTVMITIPPMDQLPSDDQAEEMPAATEPARVGDDNEPSDEICRVLHMIHVGRGEDRTARHLLGRHLPELNRGIFVLESSLGQAAAICAVEDARLAADAAVDIMRKEVARIPRIIARVEEFRCRGCGKCRDVCQYDAVTLEEREGGIRVAKIDEARCEGCGLCRVACCNGAMALLSYTTTQLLADMMGIIEEVEP